jgi:hypothetical protein
METSEVQAAAPLVVVDLGKKKAEQVKKLRKGKGKLLAELEEAIASMKADGLLDASAQTVVVVVERKPGNPLAW